MNYKESSEKSVFRFPLRAVDKPPLPDMVGLHPHFRRSSSDTFEFDYAGVYRHASETDCNFLETESLRDGTVVLAIGDNSLFPDALPIRCVRHYLRRTQSRDTSDPVVAAGRMNEIIHDCCTKIACLSCFYAQYTPGKRTLRYINAGHHAPILIRQNPDEVLRLEAGGPVLGLQEAPVYADGFIQLRNGDRLVAFTHGVIEAVAAQHLRSAEHVLISLIRVNQNLKALGLAKRIISECEHACYDVRMDKCVLVAAFDNFLPCEQDFTETQAHALFAGAD